MGLIKCEEKFRGTTEKFGGKKMLKVNKPIKRRSLTAEKQELSQGKSAIKLVHDTIQ